jgi:capsular exopolysaccharide synthesis family protein
MNNTISNYNNLSDEDTIDFKQEFYKYLFFWKYFLISLSFFFASAYVINRYSHKIYDTNAKIQILDKKGSSFEMPSADDFFSSSKINLENEIEVITSSSILEKVILNLELNHYIEGNGEIMTSRTLDYPFDFISKIHSHESLSASYTLKIKENYLQIEDNYSEKEYVFKSLKTTDVNHDLPFEISNIITEKWLENGYNINFISSSALINIFKNSIVVSQLGKKSDIINLNFKNSNSVYAQSILNELVNVFNEDGVKDRQLIHKRTIDFVNNRYLYLASQLDSIEIDKKTFKVDNKLIDLPTNSAISLEKSSVSEENMFSNENQIFIVSNLLNELLKLDFELLPSNIGIENIEINSLIKSYNELVLDQRKLITSAGPNNPFVMQFNNSIIDVRANIILSLKNYLQQLKLIKEKLINQSTNIQNNVANIPDQEKSLRAIERNQQIKEALYLFLLQKGEEAQVSFAITEPSIKVVEYAVTNPIPISPNSTLIFILALILGFLLPFGILYLIFLFDTKVHSKEDLDKYNLNVVGEIPFFDLNEKDKIFLNPDDRSIISESFRMLMSNIRYLQKNDSTSHVILVTSSVKGEGKTLNALNLALSFSSVGKKVLLIGCDLRNPQLHKYIGFDKNISGLVDSLVDYKTEWKKNIINPFDSQSLDILLSGPVPPNPLNLINNGNMDLLLKDAKKIYDHIIIDSAPILLVADTQSLINKSDVLIFLTRCNITDKNVLSNIKMISDKPDTNVGVILNGVGQQNSYGYSYGYRYGYGYNYSYNYGYGYGYNEESS